MRFDPGATIYHERARACFADTEIQFVGFVASPEGKGGVMTFSLRPEWLAYPSFHVQPSDGGPVATGLRRWAVLIDGGRAGTG